MNRSRTALVAVAGGLVALMIGSGLLALISDSITSPGNDFSSGTFAVAAHDVRAAAIEPQSSDCDAMTMLGDGPLPAVLSADMVGLNGDPMLQFTDFCIRNDGSQVAQLRASLVVTAETDTACSTGEAEAGDACGGQTTGELSTVLQWQFPTHGTFTSLSCAEGSLVDFGPVNTGIVDPDLAPGETCRVYLAVAASPTATDEAKLRAQTDGMHLDIVFTLEDAA